MKFPDDTGSSYARCRGTGEAVKLDRAGNALCPVCGWLDVAPRDVIQHSRDCRIGTVQAHEEDTPALRDPGRNRVTGRDPRLR